jgi:Raf kinase inhibitor-like YbhB/YbcL family protein
MAGPFAATDGHRVGPSCAYGIVRATAVAFTLTTSAFRDGDVIPTRFTCDGEDVPPPLSWQGAPEGTRSFALIVDDPDAPGGTFTHWLLHDIPGNVAALPASAGKALRNGFGRGRYGGPCPPRGDPPHRYVFTLYALDVPAVALHDGTRPSLERALRAHTLGVARLTGRYGRP